MKRVIIVQARMTSSRLPGKVLMDLCGRPMLARQLARLRECTNADEIVVATTTNASDDPVIDLARAEGVRWSRGSEHDVLSRFIGAASETGAELIVRVTADCPLIDAQVVDAVIAALTRQRSAVDYASNVVHRTYPKGLDVEAMFLDTLLRVDRLAVSAFAREHVTPTIYADHAEHFLRHDVVDVVNNSDLRWTVDYAEDLAMVRMLYERLDLAASQVSYADLVAYVRSHPEVRAVNAGVGS